MMLDDILIMPKYPMQFCIADNILLTPAADNNSDCAYSRLSTTIDTLDNFHLVFVDRPSGDERTSVYDRDY